MNLNNTKFLRKIVTYSRFLCPSTRNTIFREYAKNPCPPKPPSCPPTSSPKSSICPPKPSKSSNCPPKSSKSSNCPPKPSKSSICPPKPKSSSSKPCCPQQQPPCCPHQPPCGPPPCLPPCPPKSCNSSAIEGKTAVITGGSVGIGYYCALAILKNGGKVMMGDVKIDEGKEAICKIVDKFGYNKAAFMKCDVTQAHDMECLFDAAIKEFKQIDIVINNAGVLMDQYWDKTIDVNVKGVIRGTLLGFNHMRKNKKGGSIINVASILGHEPCHGAPVYTGTKHFVIGFSRSIGSDYFYCQTGVKVMTLCPGVTITDMVEKSETAGQLEGFGDTGKELHKLLFSMPTQPGETCGMHIVPMLEADINGSDWISEGSEVYRVKRVDRKTLRIK